MGTPLTAAQTETWIRQEWSDALTDCATDGMWSMRPMKDGLAVFVSGKTSLHTLVLAWNIDRDEEKVDDLLRDFTETITDEDK